MTRSPNSHIGVPTAVNIGAHVPINDQSEPGTKCFVDRFSPHRRDANCVAGGRQANAANGDQRRDVAATSAKEACPGGIHAQSLRDPAYIPSDRSGWCTRPGDRGSSAGAKPGSARHRRPVLSDRRQRRVRRRALRPRPLLRPGDRPAAGSGDHLGARHPGPVEVQSRPQRPAGDRRPGRRPARPVASRRRRAHHHPATRHRQAVPASASWCATAAYRWSWTSRPWARRECSPPTTAR